jgi:Flp pilus assembly protein TadG
MERKEEGGIGRVPRRQAGGAAVEFAFVFPILFLLIYGTIVYSYLFVIKESIHFAAKEAAESAVRVDPQVADYQAVVTATARRTAAATLDWMPESQKARVIGDASGNRVQVSFEAVEGFTAVRVTLDFDVTLSTPLFPIINMYIVGRIPPMPERMVASAVSLI